jgi:hypothetical protein
MHRLIPHLCICILATAALNLSGRNSTFEQGLDYLRRSAYEGRYTSELSDLYLIQFLSPYWGRLVREKNMLFDTLRSHYPQNPCYRFLALDEAICFHPHTLDSGTVAALPDNFPLWDTNNFCLRRYAQLVKYQYRYPMPNDTAHRPDTTFDLKEFSFYPKFPAVLTTRRHSGQAMAQSNGTFWKHLTTDESYAIRDLGISSMSTGRKNFYEWHIRDALRIR